LPTAFFLFSQLLRYALKRKTREIADLGQGKIVGAGGPFSLGNLPRYFGEQSSREFRFEFFIDSNILSMANGLILVFELTRVEYGTMLLIFGVIMSMAGFVATETKSEAALSLIIFVLILFFVSELCYFSMFGNRIELFGFTILPWHAFFLPSVGFLLLVLLVSIYQRSKKSPTGKPQ
jgi:hypothetical protein